MENKHYYSIDVIRLIACILVVFIHSKFPGTIGDIIQALARFGVPVFFVISGYFLLKDNTYTASDIRKQMLNKIKKLLPVIFCIWLFYTLYSLSVYLSDGDSLADWVSDKFNLFEFSRLILFNSGRFIYDFSYTFDHLWFLFALLYVYILVFIFAPFLRKWAGYLVVILLSFLFLGEMLRIYYPIRPFGIGISTWYVTRNWLFEGVPFMMLGFVIREYEEKIKLISSKMAGIIFLIAGFLFTIVEYYIWGVKEIYLGSVFLVIGAMNLSLYFKYAKDSFISTMGRDLSALIYYFHVFIISVFDRICDDHIFVTSQRPDVFWMLRPIFVLVFTFAFSCIFDKLRKLIKKSK